MLRLPLSQSMSDTKHESHKTAHDTDIRSDRAPSRETCTRPVFSSPDDLEGRTRAELSPRHRLPRMGLRTATSFGFVGAWARSLLADANDAKDATGAIKGSYRTARRQRIAHTRPCHTMENLERFVRFTVYIKFCKLASITNIKYTSTFGVTRK